jgi:hypothetical protein
MATDKFMLDGTVYAEARFDVQLFEKVQGKAVFVADDSYPAFYFEQAFEPSRVYIEEDEDWEKVEIVLAWTNTKIPAQLEEVEVVLWDDMVLWPTLNHYAELYRAEKLGTTLKEWDYIRLEVGGLVEEMAAAVLSLGTVNGRVVRADVLNVLAVLAFLTMPPAERLSTVRSWYQRGEQGIESVSWMFEPNETAFLSPLAQHGREQRAAFGRVRLVNGDWSFAPVPAAQRGAEVDVLVKAGFPVVPHDKMKYGSMSTATHLGEMKLAIPSGDMNKPEKCFDRRKLISGTSAQAIESEESYLKIDDGHGPKPVTIGTRLKVGMSNAVAGIGLLSGGALGRSDLRVAVYERRAFRAQVMAETEITTTVGQQIAQGESVIGIEGLAVYNEPFPAEVVSVDVRDGENGSKWVHVVVRLLVESSSPKLRAGGVKASVHRSMFEQHDAFLNRNRIDVLFGTETLKNHLSLLQLFADTTRTEVVIANGFVPTDLEAKFHQWLDAQMVRAEISAPVVEELVPYLKAAGHQVVDGVVCELVQMVCGELVCEVETPVTELRAVRTAPTFLAWASLASQFKSEFAYHQQALYNMGVSPSLKTSDIQKAMAMKWGEGLAYLAEQYPAGCKITNGAALVNSLAAGREGVDEEVCFVDFRAMLAYSHGEIAGEDAMSIALHETLGMKAKVAEIHGAFAAGFAAYRQLRDAAELLGRAISFMRAATRSFALSGKLLRTLVNPARKAALLTVRGYNHIPTKEVWVSPATAEKFHLKDGKLYWVGRFPGAALLPHFLKIVEGLDDGCIFLNSWAMQVGNKGDADGDQAYLFRHSDIGNMYAERWDDRDVVVRIMTMVLANQGTFIEANDAEKPEMVKWNAPRVNLAAWHEAAEREYTLHSGIEDAGLTGFLKVADLRKKLMWVNGVSGIIDLEKLRPTPMVGPVEALGQFATKGIGGNYATMHNLHIIEQVVHPAIKGRVTTARRLAAALYEDFSLSGYKAAKWALHSALNDVAIEGDNALEMRSEKITTLVTALEAMGFKTGGDAKERRGVVSGLFMARAIHSAFGQQEELPRCYSNALQSGSVDWSPYVKLCQAFRSLTSGRGDLVVNANDWQEVVSVIPDSSVLAEVAGSIFDVYEMLTLTTNTLKSVADAEADEAW